VKKGVIMDVDERFLTLLTPEGEFLKARKQKQDYLIGEEIDFFPVSEGQKKKSMFLNLLPGKALPAAAIAVIVAASSFVPFINSNDVYAYMSIDVNPSIELAVNDDLEVIDLEAYNAEGEKIISEIKNWKHLDVTQVTTNIIEEIKEQGYFENHDKVVISTVYEEKKEMKVEKKLEANIEKIEAKIEDENLQLTVVQGTKQELKAAHKQGVTTGVFKEKHQKIEQKKKSDTTEVEDKGKNNTSKGKSEDKKIEKEDKGNEPNKEEKIQKGKQDIPGKVKKDQDDKKEKKNNKTDDHVKKTENNQQVVNNDSKGKNKDKSKDKSKDKNKDKNKDRNNDKKKNDENKEKKKNKD
jgi:hypothetical protein